MTQVSSVGPLFWTSGDVCRFESNQENISAGAWVDKGLLYYCTVSRCCTRGESQKSVLHQLQVRRQARNPSWFWNPVWSSTHLTIIHQSPYREEAKKLNLERQSLSKINRIKKARYILTPVSHQCLKKYVGKGMNCHVGWETGQQVNKVKRWFLGINCAEAKKHVSKGIHSGFRS